MRWSAGGPASGRQFSEFQGRARAFAKPISTVIRQFTFWQGTDRFDSGRRPVDTIYVMWWPAGCAHGRGRTTNRGCRPTLESPIPPPMPSMPNARVMRSWLRGASYRRDEKTQRNHDKSDNRGVQEDIRIAEHRGLHPEHLVDPTDSIVADRASGPPHCPQRLFVRCNERFEGLIEWGCPLRQVGLVNLGAFGNCGRRQRNADGAGDVAEHGKQRGAVVVEFARQGQKCDGVDRNKQESETGT